MYVLVISLLFVQKYEVDAILRDRKLGDDQEYLVRWVGNYAPSWVSGKIREDAPDLVSQYTQVSELGLFATRALSITVVTGSYSHTSVKRDGTTQFTRFGLDSYSKHPFTGV